jgi:hypothetical protein
MDERALADDQGCTRSLCCRSGVYDAWRLLVTDIPPSDPFLEKRREIAKKNGRTLEEDEPQQNVLPSVDEVDEDLIPDVLPERSDEENQIDDIIRSIGILDAYRKWIGKKVDEYTTSLTEGIKVSCPIPGHLDTHPSAWLNSEKKTWFCGGCNEGGDVYDLAAIKFGYPRPEYKDGKAFHDLRREMAESYGWHFKKVSGVEIAWQETEADSGSSNAPVESTSDPAPRQKPQHRRRKRLPSLQIPMMMKLKLSLAIRFWTGLSLSQKEPSSTST